jgi:4-amino-4-deoxy-L-arabinose transferase-like glycosyltransferase
VESEPRLSRIQWALPISIAVACLATLAYLGRLHTFGTYATETDFYHLYAPDAERIASWQFPENTFQGPGYPALVALVTALTGDVFASAMWISILSAALVGMLVFRLHARLFGYWVGVGAQLIMLVSGPFPTFALSAATDVFFLLLCVATLVLFTDDRITTAWRVIGAAALAGLACLTRYNGVFLPATCVVGITALNLFDRAWRERFQLAALFTVVFLVTVSPWLLLNYQHHGSPFYNTNYLNIAALHYSDLVAGDSGQDATRRLSAVFHSLGDVLRYDPRRILARYPINVYESVSRILTADLVGSWVGWLALAGGALAVIERRSKNVALLLLAGSLYVLLNALNHWETRYYFFMTVILSGLAVYAVSRPLTWALARGWLTRRGWAAIPVAVVAVVWTQSLIAARDDVARFSPIGRLRSSARAITSRASRSLVVCASSHASRTCPTAAVRSGSSFPPSPRSTTCGRGSTPTPWTTSRLVPPSSSFAADWRCFSTPPPPRAG